MRCHGCGEGICRCTQNVRDPEAPPDAGGKFDLTMRRLGVVMEPDPADPSEADGVLNPGAARGRDGELYLFPRLVASGNYSRVGKARVAFQPDGDPCGVERLNPVLEPGPQYERHGDGGGCEDPRITYFRPLDIYLMTYVAWGSSGPRIALAVSNDLWTWRRTGCVDFRPEPDVVDCTDFDNYQNKDGIIFPDAVPGPDGRPALALIHRPVYDTAPDSERCGETPCGITDPRASLWISYCAMDDLRNGRFSGRLRVGHHHCIAKPWFDWEAFRIGGGAPPILTRHGWLLVYHGVSIGREGVVYRAGVMLLDPQDPRRVLYRSPAPVLEPIEVNETTGVVANVVFPTGLDVRTDLGKPDRMDVYYGMADTRIGAATFTLPEAM